MGYGDKYRTDMDITDEATGRARVEMAAASKARKNAEAKALAAENAEQRRKNQATALRTDANIEDEEAGARRIALAAESKARKSAEAKALAAENAKQRKRNASRGPATDFNIEDDPAGRARLEFAAASKARREAQQRELAELNARMRNVNQTTAQRTDDDINDEEAGRARIEMAEASRQRRIAEAKMLRQANMEMRQRLKAMKSRTDNQKNRRAMSAHGPLKPAEAAKLAAEAARKRLSEMKQEDEAAELELLRQLLARSSVVEKKEGGWNSSPHRPVPYALRGLRPMHTMDPWSKDVMLDRKHKELPPSSSYSTAGLSRLDDGMNDSVAELYNRRQKEDRRLAESIGRPTWDPTPWRYVPPALRGVRPVTKEPWATDLAVYQQAGETLDPPPPSASMQHGVYLLN